MAIESNIFFEECSEILEELEDKIIALKDNKKPQEIINSLFRGIHTIKGSANMFDFPYVGEFAHGWESFLNELREDKSFQNGEDFIIDDDLIDLFLLSKDNLLSLLHSQDPGNDKEQQFSCQIINKLESLRSLDNRETVTEEPVLQKKLKVLIVEDEMVGRILLQTMLEEHQVHIAVDGFEAILGFRMAFTEKKPYDLVCLDLVMPGITGDVVALEMRKMDKNCKIIITSSSEDKEMIRKLVDSKVVTAYLKKPILRNDLIKAMS